MLPKYLYVLYVLVLVFMFYMFLIFKGLVTGWHSFFHILLRIYVHTFIQSHSYNTFIRRPFTEVSLHLILVSLM